MRDAQEASLATALDELVGLDDELVGEDPVRERAIRGNRVGLRVPRDLFAVRGTRSAASFEGSGWGWVRGASDQG